MGLFDKLDKLFDDKDSDGFKSQMDKVFDDLVENNPISQKVNKKIQDTANSITKEYEQQLYGHAKDHSSDESVMDNFDKLSKNWDHMFNQLVDKELSQYKVCPKCGQYSPADCLNCINCGEPLPEYTAAYKVCPFCGAKNKQTDSFCRECGKQFTIDIETKE